MARVLIYTAAGPGHAFPPVATAVALRERGHDVIVRTEGGSVGTLERLGLSAAPLDPRIEATRLEDWRARTPIGALMSAVETFNRRAEFEVPDLTAAIEMQRPNLIWVDMNAPGAAVVAEASGLPWAYYVPYPYPRHASGVPSFGPGFAPSTSPLGRARDAGMEVLKKLAFRRSLRTQNSRREAFGLPALRNANDIPLLPRLLIQFSAEPFEYPREWPANVRLVGPALWEPPAPEPAWLAEERRPIVLVTASTEFQDDAKLIRQALAALADRPYAVVATCAAHDPRDFDIPANARVERYLPHGQVLRRAVATISHGGMGTTQKALAAGVPVCVVPFARDQFEVGRRAEHCGGGTLLPARRLRPDRLRTAVEEAIECGAGAKRVAEGFARAGGAEAAATALEGLVAAEVDAGKAR